MSQFSCSNADNLEESQKQCIDDRREEECSTGEEYELGRGKYNEGVSEDQVRANVRRSEWNNNELGLLAAIGAKSVQDPFNHDLESHPLSIPRQPPFPAQFYDGYTSNDALVLSQRGSLPFSEDLTMSSGTLQGHVRDNASLMRSQLLLSSLIRHWSSRGIYDMMRSSSIALGYTPRNRNITPQLVQPSSSPIQDIQENVSRMGIDLLRQYYEQPVLIVQLLDRGLESGPFSLRITSGRNDQGVLLLGQSPMFNMADLHDRYEDMRVDVENMSYEELLDLEDRIGDVSTGVSDEMIDEHLTQRKYFILLDEKALKESCSICQEDYVEEDDLGSLECGHEFHFSCLKQWLKCKNVCPVCKSTGLSVGPKM